MTLQLSAQAGVLRGKKQKKRGEQKEKKNKVHLPLCAFLSREILLLSSSCSLFLFSLLAAFFPFSFFSHSFTFFFSTAFLFTVTFFFYCHRLISFFPFSFFSCPLSLCASLFIYLGHSVFPQKKLFIHNASFLQPCIPSATAHSQQDCRRDYNVSFQSTTNLLPCLGSMLLFPPRLVACSAIQCPLRLFPIPVHTLMSDH